MKRSTLVRKQISMETINLLKRLVEMIPYPERRRAMGDITVSLLEDKARVAENVFGWNRNSVKVGVSEFRSGILCVNNISLRSKPKAEEKQPQLKDDMLAIITPCSQADPQLRTTLLYTNLTAQSVYDTLITRGWRKEDLPGVRTISNILNRLGYRLRTVVKTKVQKKRRRQMPFLKISDR